MISSGLGSLKDSGKILRVGLRKMGRLCHRAIKPKEKESCILNMWHFASLIFGNFFLLILTSNYECSKRGKCQPAL